MPADRIEVRVVARDLGEGRVELDRAAQVLDGLLALAGQRLGAREVVEDAWRVRVLGVGRREDRVCAFGLAALEVGERVSRPLPTERPVGLAGLGADREDGRARLG